MTAWLRLLGSGRRVSWNGSIPRANAQTRIQEAAEDRIAEEFANAEYPDKSVRPTGDATIAMKAKFLIITGSHIDFG